MPVTSSVTVQTSATLLHTFTGDEEVFVYVASGGQTVSVGASDVTTSTGLGIRTGRVNVAAFTGVEGEKLYGIVAATTQAVVVYEQPVSRWNTVAESVLDRTTTALGSSSGTVDLDLEDGSDWTLTAGGNIALTASNVPYGLVAISVQFTQDGTGSRTLDLSGLGTVVSAGVLNSTADSVTEISLVTRDGGTNWTAYYLQVA